MQRIALWDQTKEKETGSKGKETPVLLVRCSFSASGRKCKELYCGSYQM